MNNARRYLVAALLLFAGQPAAAQRVLYQSDLFTVTDTSVRQGGFSAIATSRERIESNYQRAAAEVNFKFSINGLENDHPPGSDYMIYLRPQDGKILTPIYKFGVLEPYQLPQPSRASGNAADTIADVTFRLDMREALESWRTTGSYKPPNGPAIRREDFKGVHIIGNTAPLSWDFGRLVPGAPVRLHDPDGDGIYTVTLRFAATFARPLTRDGRAVWELTRDISAMPQLHSPDRLADALYNLALEELRELEREDGTLNAGGRWPGVWTRDLAWSTLLGVIFTNPEAVRRGLLARVDSTGRIIQDSGTGGSWPLSTDRIAWALAAWEYYALTGDTAWLRESYVIIRRSAEADLRVAFDSTTGLFRGESTFLDWRDQSYPRWMDAKDIGASQALGTNVLHHQTYRILARMARLLGEPAARWDAFVRDVANGINQQFWQPHRGYFAQFRYGRVASTVSPRAEMLGNALAVVTGLATAEQARSIVEQTPVVGFGVPSFWPYIPDVTPYHNAGVWPQVVGFHAWAAADVANAPAVEHALASLFRSAALFLTNKENWVAETGHFEGTEVNSDRFMASAAALVGANLRVLFGIRLAPDRLVLRPFVPRAFAGPRRIDNLAYRRARLTITLHGWGSRVREVKVDGRPVPAAEIPATLTGAHTIEITLDGVMPQASLNPVSHHATPATPVAQWQDQKLTWLPVTDAVTYVVYRNGTEILRTRDTHIPVLTADGLNQYQVAAIDQRGWSSFLSEPVRVLPRSAEQTIRLGAAPVRLPADTAVSIGMDVTVPADGVYAIDLRYANGNGAVSYGDRASVRTLLVDGMARGALLLPQRGINRWEDWGYSNAIVVRLTRGQHRIAVAYVPANANMNLTTDYALGEHFRVTRLSGA